MKKLPEGSISLFDYNIDFNTRTLYYGVSSATSTDEDYTQVVNDVSTEQLIKGLFLLEQINNKQITIIWNSHGGSWEAGIALYEFIRTMKSKVKMICYSRCRSMGSIVLQACHTRILSERCRFMIHYGTEGIDEVHSKDFEKEAEESKKINNIMEQIYLERIKEKHPKFNISKLKKLLTYNYYMSSVEAVELGLADKVI